MKLNYQQTLERVEQFNLDSGLRDFCTNACKGRCCIGCYEKSKDACHRREGRRLACSVYFCGMIVMSVIARAEEKVGRKDSPVYNVRTAIMNEIGRLERTRKRPPKYTQNPFFCKPYRKVFTDFELEASVFDDNLTVELAKEIKGLLEGKTKFADLKDEQINAEAA